MQSKNSLFLLLVIALSAIAGYTFYQTKPQYGLDVKGGVRLTYQIDASSLSPEMKKNPAALQSNLKRILDNRVGSTLGVTEGNTQAKGDDQFVVELPGFTNIETARQILNATAKVQVYHAKSVTTAKRPGRYNPTKEATATNPSVSFSNVAGQELKPGDPGYVQMLKTWDLILEGEDVAGAQPQVMGTKTVPSFNFSASGASKLEAWCRKYINQGEQLAFVMDNRVLSIAPLKDGAILSDQAFTDGDFDPKYVQKLTELIRSGALPVNLVELASEQVDPTIGQKAFESMIVAGAISLGLTAVYLMWYYAFPGVVATIAMALYSLFTLAAMKLIGATFSLPAIAGFVLSASMAVDANILVFERIKEEMHAGRRLSTAIELGFKRALNAIFDSNLSTIITSSVLFYFGSGPVKGFATTLVLGVAISFFTAITVTRSLLVGMNSLGWFNDPKYYALDRKWFFEKKWDENFYLKVIGNAKKYFAISVAIIIPGLIFLGLGGLKPNVEFQGGVEAQFTAKGTPNANSVRESLERSGFKGVNVKTASVAGNKVLYVTIPPSSTIDAKDPELGGRIATAGGFEFSKAIVSSVGPTIQAETVRNAIMSVLISAAAIVIYLAWRFGNSIGGLKNGFMFGMSAVMALLHDVVFVLGTAAIFGKLLGWEVSGLFLTSMLTVIGFSVHDTIVIFDRIRENLTKPTGNDSFETMVDKSITQSFARSLNTSLTAIGTLIILIAVGTPTPELKFMCTTMLLGILIGTYSSIFNAAPILFLWDKAIMAKKGEKAGLMAEAIAEAKIRAAQASRAPVVVEQASTTFGQAPTAADPTKDGAAGNASKYGQVRRRRSVAEQNSHEID